MAPDPIQQLEAIDVRQLEVEKHDVGWRIERRIGETACVEQIVHGLDAIHGYVRHCGKAALVDGAAKEKNIVRRILHKEDDGGLFG